MNPRKRAKNQKGVSLVEALIATLILVLLLVVVYKAFVPSMSHFKRINDQTQTEQQGLAAYQRLFADLSITNTYSITITSSPTKSITFLSTADSVFTTNGPEMTTDDLHDYSAGTEATTPDIEWKKFVIIYPGSVFAGTRRVYALLKKEALYPDSLKTEVFRLKSDKVTEIINDDTYPAVVLAKGISEASFGPPNPVPDKPIWIQIVSVQESVKGRIESSMYEFNITPRN